MKKYLIIYITIVFCMAAVILFVIVNPGREKEDLFEANVEVLASPGEGGGGIEVPCKTHETKTCRYILVVFAGYDAEGNKIYRPVAEHEEIGMERTDTGAN